VATDVVTGIAAGCELAGCALVGGETAEMPGMYQGEDYDLAGFCVGVVERSRIIDGSGVRAGDALIGIASSGPHSNGYSLIHKIIEVADADLNQPFKNGTLADALLKPTRIYVKPLLDLIGHVEVRAMAHITGGGITENLPRVLPEDTVARIDRDSWTLPAVFQWLQEQGGVSDQEMLRTFNCGVGMICCIPAEQVEDAIDSLRQAGEHAWKIGEIENGEGRPGVRYNG